MAFRKAVKGAVIGGGAIATAFGLSQFMKYRRNQVSVYDRGVLEMRVGGGAWLCCVISDISRTRKRRRRRRRS